MSLESILALIATAGFTAILAAAGHYRMIGRRWIPLLQGVFGVIALGYVAWVTLPEALVSQVAVAAFVLAGVSLFVVADLRQRKRWPIDADGVIEDVFGDVPFLLVTLATLAFVLDVWTKYPITDREHWAGDLAALGMFALVLYLWWAQKTHKKKRRRRTRQDERE